MLPETEEWVREFLRATQRPGRLGWEDISQVDGRPGHALASCTVTIRSAPGQPTRRQAVVVDLATGEHRSAPLSGDSAGARWSPDGMRLAVICADGQETDQAIVLDAETLDTSATTRLDGAVERLEWSPDGTRLALVVADAGAELSDVHGSGVIGSASAESWRPRVLPGSVGRRHLVVWDPADGSTTTLTDLNVWESAWCGDDALLALTSAGAGEDDWYGAQLARVDASSGAATAVLAPRHQLARPRGNADGTRWSVIAGAASDRDLLSGALVVASPQTGGPPAEVDTHGVHVTDQRWRDDRRIAYAGLRGLDTVIAEVDVVTGETTVRWESRDTCGRNQPELGGLWGDDPLIVRENHTSPPALSVVRGDEVRTVIEAGGPGALYSISSAGRREPLAWTSGDGTPVQGFVTLPPGDGPHALVVDVHGGPIHAVRHSWSARDPYVSVLVARGYAVLQANPRGSVGRGSAYAEAVIGDMGGRDVDDILAGVRTLIDSGVADAERVGITGVSYGGYMTAWMPCLTDQFKAGVSRSPCTDWVLFWLTSNIREFARLFVGGSVDDPASQYVSRSPLQQAQQITTPLLFTAGGRDLACPASQAHTLYTALVEHGREAELVVYPEEGHDVKHPDALVDQCARMVDWFERLMPPNANA